MKQCSDRLRGVQFSVVVPAHNEELLLPNGLRAIGAAAERVDGDVEVIVVANRCTDATVALARAAGAIVVEDESRNIAAVRNAGAAVATGDVLVTIDADCVMSPLTFCEIERLLGTGRYVGGGTKVLPERWSAGIRATYALMEMITLAHPARRRAVLVPPVGLRGGRRVRRVAAAGRGPRLRAPAPRSRQADRSAVHDHACRPDRRVVPEVRPVRRLAHVRRWRCRPARSAP